MVFGKKAASEADGEMQAGLGQAMQMLGGEPLHSGQDLAKDFAMVHNPAAPQGAGAGLLQPRTEGAMHFAEQPRIDLPRPAGLPLPMGGMPLAPAPGPSSAASMLVPETSLPPQTFDKLGTLQMVGPPPIRGWVLGRVCNVLHIQFLYMNLARIHHLLRMHGVKGGGASIWFFVHTFLCLKKSFQLALENFHHFQTVHVCNQPRVYAPETFVPLRGCSRGWQWSYSTLVERDSIVQHLHKTTWIRPRKVMHFPRVVSSPWIRFLRDNQRSDSAAYGFFFFSLRLSMTVFLCLCCWPNFTMQPYWRAEHTHIPLRLLIFTHMWA